MDRRPATFIVSPHHFRESFLEGCEELDYKDEITTWCQDTREGLPERLIHLPITTGCYISFNCKETNFHKSENEHLLLDLLIRKGMETGERDLVILTDDKFFLSIADRWQPVGKRLYTANSIRAYLAMCKERDEESTINKAQEEAAATSNKVQSKK